MDSLGDGGVCSVGFPWAVSTFTPLHIIPSLCNKLKLDSGKTKVSGLGRLVGRTATERQEVTSSESSNRDITTHRHFRKEVCLVTSGQQSAHPP